MGTVVVGRLAVLLEASTAAFESRMDAAAQVSDRFTRAQTVGSRAAIQLRSAMQNVATQGLGMAGPLGQASNALLGLVGGTTALIGAAGLGATAILMKQLTAPTEAVAAQARELAKQFNEVGSAAERLQRLRAGVGAAGVREDFLASATSGGDPIRAGMLRLAMQLFGTTAEEAAADVDKLQKAMTQHFDRMITARETEIRLIREGGDAYAVWLKMQEGASRAQAERLLGLEREAALVRALGATPLSREKGTPFTKDFGKFGKGFDDPFVKARVEGLEDVAGLSRGVGKGDLGASIVNHLVQQEQLRLQILDLMNDSTFMANLAAQGLTEEFNAMVRAMTRTEIKSQQLAVAIVMSVSSAIQAMVGGGGPSSFLQGAGGVMTALATKHPSLLIPGVVLSAFGGILGAFERQHSERERNEERRKNELIGAIREGPLRSTDIFVGDPEMGRYQRDRDDRLGGGPSRMGV